MQVTVGLSLICSCYKLNEIYSIFIVLSCSDVIISYRRLDIGKFVLVI